MRIARLRQQFARHVQARTAVGTATGTHGQLGHRAATAIGRFADLVVGDSVADTNVHSGHRGWQAMSGLPALQTKREWLSIKLMNHSRYV